MVRISDVYPTGEVRLLQDSAVRMRWREGGLQPVYMKPDQVYAVTVSLWNTSYALAPSHSLRIAVTSSNYPRFSANPNTGDLLIQNSTLKTPVIAQNTLHHSERYPSAVRLPVVSRADMPQLHDIKGVFGQAYPHVDVEQILQSHPDLFNEIANRRARSPKSQ
ncbi:galactose-binding domain-like protein [Ochromonadaceae sp. CCMP2298]|nr:galactose-binding domain-like protein [Ochromonadaceae sp. CCMP2298]